VGEAPGYYEDQSGEPFVGDAGELLTRILGSIGLSRDKVYICNVLKCRPPQNRKPLPMEVSNCQGYLRTQLSVVRPPVIVCLGSTAAYGVLGLAQSVASLRGKTFQFQSIPVICTYHPAYLLRHGEAKREVWEDMKRVKLLLMAAMAGSPSGVDKP
jgi:DNA polymerase